MRDWVSATAASSQYISVPVAQRELLAVTGIHNNGSVADVDFQWRWAAVNEVGAALYTKDTEYNSTVGFIHYDDGWRVIEGGALKNSQGLTDALKNAAPSPITLMDWRRGRLRPAPARRVVSISTGTHRPYDHPKIPFFPFLVI